jgi:hypothetical protein
VTVYEERLRAVLSAVQDYLPPDGTSAHDTLTTIIGLVDPWPLAAAPSVLPPLQEPVKYDDVLAPFLTLMRRELHANCGKGDRPGWLAMSPNEALLEVYYHLLSKLQKAVKHNDGPAIQEFSADVANMSMMVLDICGGLAWVDDAAPLPVQEDERVQVRMLTSREVANLWRLQPAAEDITDAIQREFCRVNGLTLPAASEGAAP